MKKNLLLSLAVCLISISSAFSQKIISEGTVHYTIKITNSDKSTEIADSASLTVYLKGPLSRTEMVNSLGSETTIHDSKDGSAVILKQYSGQKLMITLTKQNWADKNKKYGGVIFALTDETKTINGYSCKKAIASLVGGDSFIVYYATDITVFNKEYDPVFKNVPGLPVQYEFVKGSLHFQYTLSAYDQNPVSYMKFEIPKSGYRVMTFEESQQNKKN